MLPKIVLTIHCLNNYFLTVGQNNFGNKIPFFMIVMLVHFKTCWWYISDVKGRWISLLIFVCRNQLRQEILFKDRKKYWPIQFTNTQRNIFHIEFDKWQFIFLKISEFAKTWIFLLFKAKSLINSYYFSGSWGISQTISTQSWQDVGKNRTLWTVRLFLC